jgi:hypothetical protein
LEVNEGCVAYGREFDVAQYGTCKEGTDALCLKVVMFVSADDVRGKRTSWETVTVMRSFSPPGGYASVYCGGSCFPRKARKAREIPSRQTRSYLRASQMCIAVAPTGSTPVCGYFDF